MFISFCYDCSNKKALIFHPNGENCDKKKISLKERLRVLFTGKIKIKEN